MTEKPLPKFTRQDSIAILPKLEGLGGPTSFQAKLREGLAQRGLRSHFDPSEAGTRALLVIGGTRHLAKIWQAKRRGMRVVQRLNGMNWIHRKRKTSLKHYLRSEYGNFNLSVYSRASGRTHHLPISICPLLVADHLRKSTSRRRRDL